MSDGLDRAPGRQLDRRVELVLQLPVEVVVGHVQDDFFAAVRIRDHERHVLPAQVHVRPHDVERHIFLERRYAGERPVVHAVAE